MRTRIKICGITSVSDAFYAVEAGADAIGLVFYAPSPRHVSVAQARVIASSIPAFVTRVALFVDPTHDFVAQVIAQTGVDLLQFHGQESAEFCEAFERPYIKAIAMNPQTDWRDQIKAHGRASGILLDAYHPQMPGGSGETFDWALLEHLEMDHPLILAGGLTPENVAQAIAQVRPYAVDVSSGVEFKKGVKSAQQCQAFCAAVARQDTQNLAL
jgi:phosphoribosylanthranilate isomerase